MSIFHTQEWRVAIWSEGWADLGVPASCWLSSVNDDRKDNGGREIACFLPRSKAAEVNNDRKLWKLQKCFEENTVFLCVCTAEVICGSEPISVYLEQ